MTEVLIAVAAALGGALITLAAVTARQRLRQRAHAQQPPAAQHDLTPAPEQHRPPLSPRMSPRRAPRLARLQRLLGRRSKAVLSADRTLSAADAYTDLITAPETTAAAASVVPRPQPAVPDGRHDSSRRRPARDNARRGRRGRATADARADSGPTPDNSPPASGTSPGAATGPLAWRDTSAESLDEGPLSPPSARSGRRGWLWYEETGAELLLPAGHVTIGRSADNDVRLDHPAVSRRHASLRHHHGTWWLLPEVTSNGTYVNGQIIHPGEQVALASGDRLRLGTDIEVTFMAPVDESLQFQVATRTTPGTRRVNEDALLATERTLAVADGVAGRPAGHIASRTAIEIVHSAPNDLALAGIVRAAHDEIARRAAATPPWVGMATTLDVVRLDRTDTWVVMGAHVGDGMVFLQQGEEPSLLTASDRLGARLARQNPEQARQLEGTADYDRLAAGLGFHNPPEPQLWAVPARVGQRIIVASDGLLSTMPLDELTALLRRYRGCAAEQVADLLLSASINAKDNVTVIVADIADVGIDAPTADDASTSDNGPLPLPADSDTTGWDR
jgi:protein phosphatase